MHSESHKTWQAFLKKKPVNHTSMKLHILGGGEGALLSYKWQTQMVKESKTGGTAGGPGKEASRSIRSWVMCFCVTWKVPVGDKPRKASKPDGQRCRANTINDEVAMVPSVTPQSVCVRRVSWAKRRPLFHLFCMSTFWKALHAPCWCRNRQDDDVRSMPSTVT